MRHSFGKDHRDGIDRANRLAQAAIPALIGILDDRQRFFVAFVVINQIARTDPVAEVAAHAFISIARPI